MKIKILFTKIIENSTIEKYLSNNKFETSFLPVIKIKFNNTNFDVKNYRNFILTSESAVKYVENINLNKNSFFFVVGEKSGRALEKLGYSVKIISKNAFELFEEIKKNIEPCNLLHFCSSRVLPTLEENFSKTDFKYEKLKVYETESIFPKWNNPIDSLVFFSPSGVESFIKNNKITTEKLFAIGNTTAKEIRKFTDKEITISKNENTEDLLRMINEYYK